MTDDLKTLCDACIDIARDAGKKILDVYNGEYDVEHKEDDSPLTTADIAAHTTITKALQALTPDIPILSEEAADIPFETRQTWSTYWLVDPLDGTREFIKRNGEFTVNIALIQDHRSILGVINVPVLGIDYFAYQGGGAFKSSHELDPQQIHSRKLSDGKIIIVGSRSHASEKLIDYLKSIGDHELVSMGSSLKSCLVAEGKADLYPRLGLTSEWDTAAAQCIVEEAGGFMTKTDMKPMRYNTKDSLLNPEFFVFGDNSVDWKKYL